MVSEGTITDDIALREIQAAFKQTTWRYPVRRIIARIRDDSWRDGYAAGQRDADAKANDGVGDG